jgi:hypothetical protein
MSTKLFAWLMVAGWIGFVQSHGKRYSSAHPSKQLKVQPDFNSTNCPPDVKPLFQEHVALASLTYCEPKNWVHGWSQLRNLYVLSKFNFVLFD